MAPKPLSSRPKGLRPQVELAAAPEFDKRIVNNVVDEAADELWHIIAEEFGL